MQGFRVQLFRVEGFEAPKNGCASQPIVDLSRWGRV